MISSMPRSSLLIETTVLGKKIWFDSSKYVKLREKWGPKWGYIFCELQSFWHRQYMTGVGRFSSGPKRRLRRLFF